MEKKIQDYLPLYLGCECMADDNRMILYGVERTDTGTTAYCGQTDGIHQAWRVENCDFKLFLRPLSDMNNVDVKDLDAAVWGIEDDSKMAIAEYRAMILRPWPLDMRPGFPIYVKTINQLRKMGFDCDELIKSGLAIDKTK